MNIKQTNINDTHQDNEPLFIRVATKVKWSHSFSAPGGQAVPQDPSPSSTCPPGPTASTNGSSDIMVNFDPDPADLALSSVPGQEAFDPRRHRFSEEELKPQPMIKKARKMLVPNEQKVLHLPQFYRPVTD